MKIDVAFNMKTTGYSHKWCFNKLFHMLDLGVSNWHFWVFLLGFFPVLLTSPAEKNQYSNKGQYFHCHKQFATICRAELWMQRYLMVSVGVGCNQELGRGRAGAGAWFRWSRKRDRLVRPGFQTNGAHAGPGAPGGWSSSPPPASLPSNGRRGRVAPGGGFGWRGFQTGHRGGVGQTKRTSRNRFNRDCDAHSWTPASSFWNTVIHGLAEKSWKYFQLHSLYSVYLFIIIKKSCIS